MFWCSSSVLVVFWGSGGVLGFWCSVGAQKHGGLKKYMSLAASIILEFKLLLEVLLDLLQPIQAVLSLQVNLRPLEMLSIDSPCQKNLGLKKTMSLVACLEVELLLEVHLDLLQLIQAVLALQVHLRPLKMVPYDFPCQKTWGLKKNQVPSLLGCQVTPRRHP